MPPIGWSIATQQMLAEESELDAKLVYCAAFEYFISARSNIIENSLKCVSCGRLLVDNN